MVRPTAWIARGGVYDDGAGELSLSVFLALASGTTEGFLGKKYLLWVGLVGLR